ncbi:MAG: prephenate dehydrogenase [Crocinitomicaceae bacterium]|nr:prephenate dehydrogenase [Crocinitomicaceae bacterium]
MNVTIIGIGLIGGSIAKDIRKKGLANKIIGVESSKEIGSRALDLGLVDEISELKIAVSESELLILATPVDISLQLIPDLMGMITQQTIVDVGSTKWDLYNSIETHPKRDQFVLAHPMAGTEFSGPEAAVEHLFEDKVCILCDTQENNLMHLQKAKHLFRSLGMRILLMKSEEHDLHAAYVSHISHISSFALALTVLEKEKDEKKIFDLASGGFDSTVRLAKSSPEMWAPIFRQNKANVLRVLDTYIEKLNAFKEEISKGNKIELVELIREANRIGKVLK